MGKKSPNPNNIDPTEEPLNKVPLVVDADSGQYPEDSPVEEGIEEEQQGDLEGLDGQNNTDELDDDDGPLDNVDELDPDDDAA